MYKIICSSADSKLPGTHKKWVDRTSSIWFFRGSSYTYILLLLWYEYDGPSIHWAKLTFCFLNVFLLLPHSLPSGPIEKRCQRRVDNYFDNISPVRSSGSRPFIVLNFVRASRSWRADHWHRKYRHFGSRLLTFCELDSIFVARRALNLINRVHALRRRRGVGAGEEVTLIADVCCCCYGCCCCLRERRGV